MKFEPRKIKALALDLDGTTLLPDAALGERTASCLKNLIFRGMQVLFVTGRAVEGAERYWTAIGAEGPMVFFNGAEIVDIPSGKMLSADLLDLDVVDFGIDLARSMGLHYQIYLPAGVAPNHEKNGPKKKWEVLIMERSGQEAQMYRRHTGIIPVEMDLKTAIAAPDLRGCVKAMFITDPSLHDGIRKKMIDRFCSRINVSRTFSTFLEIMNAGVSKGEGLKIALRHRGLTAEEVIAFGDEESDLSMFGAAGFSAAPADSRENIRRAADFVFGPSAEEGLAAFLEKYFR
jgi:Cof subfamily protein (haloacid dehalogenase superfamily)